MTSDLGLDLYVFMLATFLGLEIIRKVSPLLHTPLMSLTNAISAISVVGAILITGAQGATMLSKVLGFIAITSAVTNIVSGFLITDRMLKMFKRGGPGDAKPPAKAEGH
jgi:H+-translocating NAD(P) transhydrogenase subunit alpha